ncbi:NAD(P)H-dependent oxidoreductase [Patescibacteria group bacterium]|nr:NAD(P)H-dependent oxidoreductase [Patescibacteria group bacterium]
MPVILATNREGRKTENVAKLLGREMEAREGIETTLFDVKDFKFPQDNYGQSIKDQFPEWRDAIIKADGLVIVTPEYNHGYPGSLKSALDLLLPEYKHKAVGVVGVSAGPWGATRVVENLVPVMRELGLVTTSVSLNFPNAHELFDEQGKLKDEAYEKRISNFLDELEWMAKALRWGRENSKSEK